MRTVGDTLHHVFEVADAHRVTPLRAAIDIGERRLAGGELGTGAAGEPPTPA